MALRNTVLSPTTNPVSWKALGSDYFGQFLQFSVNFVGIEMCCKQSISRDIQELIQTEMATLVKSVEDNKESWMQDQVVLKDKVQNLTQVFGTEIKGLEAKRTALRSGIQRLESRQDDLEVKLGGLEQGTDKNNDLQTRGKWFNLLLAPKSTYKFSRLILIHLFEEQLRELMV